MPNIPLDAELAAKIAAAGYEAVAFRTPKRNEYFWMSGTVHYTHTAKHRDCVRLILSPLVPEQPKAEEIDPNGKYETRDGRWESVIISRSVDGKHLDVVLRRKADMRYWAGTYRTDGLYGPEGLPGEADLVPIVPPAPAAPEAVSEPPYDVWLNIYTDYVTAHPSQNEANRCAYGYRLRCVHVREVREPGVDSKEGK